MINQLVKNTKKICLVPFLIMGLLLSTDVFFQTYADYLVEKLSFIPNLMSMEQVFYLVFMGLCSYWLIARGVNSLAGFLGRRGFLQRHGILTIMLPFFVSVLKILAFLMIFNIIAQKLTLPDNLLYLFNKTSSILIICSISGILCKIIAIAEQLLLNHYTADLRGMIVERRIVTQTLILKRVAYAIVAILTLGAILMLFDNVRALGASVMTTAGVIGLVLTFTAQRSLGSIFSGLEIAITQPIKIGDKVMIENKEGTIQEINFRNVVLKLGDWSHYIVPTSAFLEKPFQNWNRVEDTHILGSIHLYVDFTIPISQIRFKFHSILEQSPLWDKNIGRLQVSELQEKVMQIKISTSAANSDDLSDLQALIREELISYIVHNFPEALPKIRSLKS